MMKEDRRRSRNTPTTTEAHGVVTYDLKVSGHGVLRVSIVTVDEETGRVEFRASIEGQ